MEPPILVYLNFAKRFKLYVDSSHLARAVVMPARCSSGRSGTG
jgi:hypothetical protein